MTSKGRHGDKRKFDAIEYQPQTNTEPKELIESLQKAPVGLPLSHLGLPAKQEMNDGTPDFTLDELRVLYQSALFFRYHTEQELPHLVSTVESTIEKLKALPQDQ